MALSIIPVLNGDRELAVRTATYGPGIDQSQRAKTVSHIIKYGYKTAFLRRIVTSGLHRKQVGRILFSSEINWLV